jgi:hypothetical protein
MGLMSIACDVVCEKYSHVLRCKLLLLDLAKLLHVLIAMQKFTNAVAIKTNLQVVQYL